MLSPSQLTILVPGIAGSKLYCGCTRDNLTPHIDSDTNEGQINITNSTITATNTRNVSTAGLKRLYPRRRWFFNSAIDQHADTCTNIITKPLRTFWHISIYDKFIRKLSKNSFTKLEIFSYDWRRNPVDLACELLEFVKQQNLVHYTHLKLIGHSLGGFLIRIMIEYLQGICQLAISPEQITVYECGTPMYGSENINDYNYGFELAAILASRGIFYSSCPLQKVTKRDIKRIKPFLFSVSDLERIISGSTTSLLYLLPTPMILTLQQMLDNDQINLSNENFPEIYAVHRCLARLQFPVKYIFFFNISYHRIEDVYIPFRGHDIIDKITVHDIRPGKHNAQQLGCGIYLRRLLKSDGLVVPYSGKTIPLNCNIYVDESEKCSHAYLMNSTELWRLALNSQSHYEYYNQELFVHDGEFVDTRTTVSHYDDNISQDILPGYDEIFNEISADTTITGASRTQ